MHKFVPGVMENHFPGDSYVSPRRKPGLLARLSPKASLLFGIGAGAFPWLMKVTRQGRCDDQAWVYSSLWVLEELEAAGFRIEVENLDALRRCRRPRVFVANHMSTLETFVLPAIIRPRLPVTFVVKDSLVSMPGFGPIMRTRDPVVLGRVNPREDLKTVLREGGKRLERGISIIVFPQSTRSVELEMEHFNSIGVKLARAANVPVMPLALKTDAWGSGGKIKELGRLRPDLPVRFRFGEPMAIEGNGKREHAAICDFISRTVRAWQATDGINRS